MSHKFASSPQALYRKNEERNITDKSYLFPGFETVWSKIWNGKWDFNRKIVRKYLTNVERKSYTIDQESFTSVVDLKLG